MKKWLLVALTLVLLSSCSWSKLLQRINDMDWERDDQTVRIVDIFIK
ncbi:MAG: lipoprotein [Desulfomonilaceae bacterium]